jgi:hypothetical protein
MRAAASAVPIYPSQQRNNGFVKHPKYFESDRPRLVGSLVQEWVLRVVEMETLGAIPEKGKEPPKWSRPITNEEFAAFSGCTVRAVELAMADLLDRKVLERRKGYRKGCSYSIPFETWPNLPTRGSNVISITDATPQEAEQETPEEVKAVPQKTPIQVVPNWQKIRAGGRTKRVELPVSAWFLRVRSEAGIQYRSEIVDGVLDVVIKGEQQEKREGKANSANSGSLYDSEPKDSKQRGNFHIFEAAWLRHGINAAPDDWTEARSTWNMLELAEQLRAVQGVTDRFEQGEYDDPKFVHLPQNYLRKKLWMRPVRPRKKPDKVKIHKDDATAFATLDLARRLDQEVARRKR